MLPGGLTIANGATLAVAAGVTLQVGANQALTDNGSVTFSNATVTYLDAYQSTTQINVNGTLAASGTTFNSQGYTSQLNVAAGAELAASTTSFSITDVYLNGGVSLGASDLAKDSFNCPLYLPESDVQYLAAAPYGVAASDNATFNAIEIEAGTVPGGQVLSLSQIGTGSKANLVYVLPSGLTVAAGAAMSVAAGVTLQVGANQALTDNGSVTFSNATVTYLDAYQSTTQINVNGTLAASGTTFNSQGYTSQLNVAAGAELAASTTSFSITDVYLNGGVSLARTTCPATRSTARSISPSRTCSTWPLRRTAWQLLTTPSLTRSRSRPGASPAARRSRSIRSGPARRPILASSSRTASPSLQAGRCALRRA